MKRAMHAEDWHNRSRLFLRKRRDHFCSFQEVYVSQTTLIKPLIEKELEHVDVLAWCVYQEQPSMEERANVTFDIGERYSDLYRGASLVWPKFIRYHSLYGREYILIQWMDLLTFITEYPEALEGTVAQFLAQYCQVYSFDHSRATKLECQSQTQYSGTQILRQSLWMKSIITIVSLFFLSGAVLSGTAAFSDGHTIDWLFTLLGGFGFVAFICFLVISGKKYLRLTPEGFSLWAVSCRVEYTWADVEVFAVKRIRGQKVVIIHFAPIVRETHRFTITHQEAALIDTYGMSAEQLAILLNQYKEFSVRA